MQQKWILNKAETVIHTEKQFNIIHLLTLNNSRIILFSDVTF
jgi:hypothetical protein